MAWDDTQDIIVEGLGFIRLSPCTIDNAGAISAFTTPIDLTMLTKEDSEVANATAEPEYKEKNLTNMTKLKLQVTTTTVNPATGETTAAGSNAYDFFEVSAMVGKSQMDSLITNLRADKLWAGCMGIGRTTTGVVAGYQHLLGKISGNLKETRSGGEMSEVTIKLQGGKTYELTSGVDYTDYNTVMTGAGNLITAVGKETGYTIAAIDSAGMTAILTGQIHRTAAS